jgi:hypothetical protein
LNIRYTSKYESKMRSTMETVGVLTLKVAGFISAFAYSKVRNFVSRFLVGTDPLSLARPEVWGPPVQNLGVGWYGDGVAVAGASWDVALYPLTCVALEIVIFVEKEGV